MFKINSNNQIKIGAIISYISILLNIAVGLLYTPWMIGKIGKSDYALYTLAYSIISMFLIDFGLSSAISRFISKYKAEKQDDKINDFVGMVYGFYLLIDTLILIALIIVFFSIDVIYAKFTPDEIHKFKIVYSIAAGFSLINFPCLTFNGILTAYEKFIQLKLADLFYRLGVVFLIIIALLNGYGLYALVTVNAVVGLAIILYKLFVIKKYIPIKLSIKKANKKFAMEILSFSLWTTIAGLAQRLIFNITPTILGMILTSATGSIAVFGIIVTLEGYTYTFSTAINGMFLPKISRYLTEDNSDKKLTKLTINVGKFQFILNGLIFAGFFVVGEQFIRLWMGEDFIKAYIGLILVLLPGLFYNSLQIANTTLIAQNKVKAQAIINIVMGVSNVIFCIAFCKLFGFVGASLSIFIAYFIRVIMLLIYINKNSFIDVKKFIKKCYLKLSIPLILTILIGLLFIKPIKMYGWVGLGIKSILISLIYFIFVFILGLDKSEKMFLFKIKSKMKKS